jgi:hypothetical protein
MRVISGWLGLVFSLWATPRIVLGLRQIAVRCPFGGGYQQRLQVFTMAEEMHWLRLSPGFLSASSTFQDNTAIPEA